MTESPKTLRIGFDMDGVLADLEGAYRTVEASLSGPEARASTDAVWAAIRTTPNFWETLAPLDPGAVRRIHELMLAHRWEVFFITQRPATDGDTVQRQTQRWLVAQGFDLPSVLVIQGSRGAAAAALKLDYLIDDSPQNCVDVKADSTAKPMLIAPDDDEVTARGAERLGFGVYRTVGQALDAIEQTPATRSWDGVRKHLAQLVGWK